LDSVRDAVLEIAQVEKRLGRIEPDVMT
jgi:hypothetical protein